MYEKKQMYSVQRPTDTFAKLRKDGLDQLDKTFKKGICIKSSSLIMRIGLNDLQSQ